ncbi:CHAT domain-containing protein [Saccharopolyspora sp. HNM0983]|uniref:CHAT domain-containing protein n=1 Tax=Saccharopolyspora montiporae TaxID=2781240 RepID=A0A929FXN0_9PSEU|nr:CHAT domain-containing tetratricopeptide repeat protein [Saccharopolyspora sp. HNM0983]MBE9374841.1 CHAT domain-containing protein [Saccharopolyspora sp. HNM0983]
MAGLLTAGVRAVVRRAAPAGRDRVPETVQRGIEPCAAGDPHSRAAAAHEVAEAELERGHLRRAAHRARSGLRAAVRAGLPECAARLRLTLARIELDGGDLRACSRNLRAAELHLPDADRPRAVCLRGLLLCQRDRFVEAVAELTSAVRGFGETGDRSGTALALVGRGSARMRSGELGAAERDLVEAERIFAAQGCTEQAAGCVHRRACAAFRAGDLPRALRLFERAVAAGLDTGSCPDVLLDRAEALAEAGLHDEAHTAVQRAVRRLAAERGRGVRLAEALLALAGCRLRAGDAAAARCSAEQAGQLFREQHKPAWAALAAATGLQARLLGGVCSSRELVAAQRTGRLCAAYGWVGPAARLWLTAARCAHRAGMRQRYRRLLRLARGIREDAAATSQQRCTGWLAEALLAEEADEPAALFAACRAGLREAQDHAAGIAPFELRAQALAPVQELGEVAVRASLRSGSARGVLRWTERVRASALHRPALLPPADPELDAALVRLRSAALHVRGSAAPKPSLEQVGVLEQQVRHRAMLARDGVRGTGDELCLDDVHDELGDAVLLSFFGHAGRLRAASVVSGRVRLHEIGARDEVDGQVARLVHLLSRQAERDAVDPAAVRPSVLARAARQVQSRLLGPVLDELGERRPLVIVPSGSLHAVPWSALPVCRGREVTASPSLRCWLRAARDARANSGRGRLWVSGPGLDHAEREVRALHGEAAGRLLTGSRARCPDVLAALDGVRIAHIAAHGTFRDQQPLLSCLDLADGPLYCYDLDRIRTAPATVVLSACEVGRSVAGRGNQVSGVAATLLGRGTSTVIASVVPVPDERTAAVMLSLHRRLRRSVPPAQALAAAQHEHGESGFVCLGYGGRCAR